MGAAIDVFEGAQALRVPRARFAPVKTTDDLLVAALGRLRADGRGDVVLAPERVTRGAAARRPRPRPLQARAPTSRRASPPARRRWSRPSASRCAATCLRRGVVVRGAGHGRARRTGRRRDRGRRRARGLRRAVARRDGSCLQRASRPGARRAGRGGRVRAAARLAGRDDPRRAPLDPATIASRPRTRGARDLAGRASRASRGRLRRRRLRVSTKPIGDAGVTPCGRIYGAARARLLDGRLDRREGRGERSAMNENATDQAWPPRARLDRAVRTACSVRGRAPPRRARRRAATDRRGCRRLDAGVGEHEVEREDAARAARRRRARRLGVQTSTAACAELRAPTALDLARRARGASRARRELARRQAIRAPRS